MGCSIVFCCHVMLGTVKYGGAKFSILRLRNVSCSQVTYSIVFQCDVL